MARSLRSKGSPRASASPEKRVVVVEDVTTTGGSAMKAVDALRQTGAEVALVLTMVDREEGADVTFKASRPAVPLALQGGGVFVRCEARALTPSPRSYGERVGVRGISQAR